MPTKHIPVMVLVNASSSAGEIRPIFNRSMEWIINALKSHPNANEIMLMAAHYSSRYMEQVCFRDINQVSANVLDLPSVLGPTNTGCALENALNSLEAKLKHWDDQGISYGRPILLLVTDYHISPGRNPSWPPGKEAQLRETYRKAFQNMAEKTRNMEKNGELTLAAVRITHIGYARETQELKALTNIPECVFIARYENEQKWNLDEVIDWLKRAVSRSAEEHFENNRKAAAPRGMKWGIGDIPPEPEHRGLKIDSVICEFFDLNRSNS